MVGLVLAKLVNVIISRVFDRDNKMVELVIAMLVNVIISRVFDRDNKSYLAQTPCTSASIYWQYTVTSIDVSLMEQIFLLIWGSRGV